MPTRPVKAVLGVSAVLFLFFAVRLLTGGSIIDFGVAFDSNAPGERTTPDERPTLDAADPTQMSPFNVVATSMFDANDDPDAADAPLEAGVRPIVALVTDAAERPLAGVPVILLGAKLDGPVLAGPRYTKNDGRARFPIDVALEREGDVVVAARAGPGTATWTVVKAALDRATDVALKLDAGLTASVRLFEPEGDVYRGRARVRKVVLDEPAPETGERAAQLTAAFRETTPRSTRVGDVFRFVGLAPGEAFTLYAWAEGFEPAFQPVQTPEQPARPFPIDAVLGRRLASVTFVAAPSESVGSDELLFGCRAASDEELVTPPGADDRPTQKSPQFRLDVAPGVPHRLRVDAYRNAASTAAAEFEVPALRPGEIFDSGTIRLFALGVVLAGSVTDADDRPLSGAAIEAMPNGSGRELTTETDAAGRFVLRGLAGRGPYQVAAHAKGRVAERRADVAEGTTDLKVALDAAGAVAGRAILPAGVSSERVRVRAVRPDRAPTATALGADGSFRISELSGGVYVLILDGPEIQTLRVGAVVVTPPETNAEDRLQRLAPLPAARGQP